MPVQRTSDRISGRFVELAVAAVLATTLLAANGLGTYLIAGRNLAGMKGFPEPTGWIARVLVVESWPTYRGVEGQWLVWAVGAAGLLGLAAVRKGGASVSESARPVLSLLLAISLMLVVLVAIRAGLAAVPLVGLTWTWQLALALLWMLALYVWTDRLVLSTLAKAIAIPISVLCGISLLFCIQANQSAPNWPVGNVLLLTTSCLAGTFLLGTWAYQRLLAARHTGAARDYLAGLVVTGLFVLVLIVLAMAGRRAAVVGLAAGCGFIAIVTVFLPAGRGDSDGASQAWRQRARLLVLVGVLIVLLVGAIAARRLLSSGRWQSVLFRIEMYKATNSIFWSKPTTPLVGVGPGHLGFDLTCRMRPLHAASPRLFHGDVFEYTHSEPLQAIAELGLPLGLLYLALPLGGLIGFGVAYRRGGRGEGRGTRGEGKTEERGRRGDAGTRGRGEGEKGQGLEVGRMSAAATCPEAAASGAGPGERRSAQMERFHGRKQRDHGTQTTRHETDKLMVLGLGAALAACLAAEATSVGMRYPGVAVVVWTLAGIGWACGARAMHRQGDRRQETDDGTTAGVSVRAGIPGVVGMAGIAASLLVLGVATLSVRASGYLYQAQQAFGARQYTQADALLSRWPCVPIAESWMAWKYLQGRTDEALMRTAGTPAFRSAWQAKALGALEPLVRTCPAYQDAVVSLGKVTGDWGKIKACCEEMTRYDPYEREARLLEAFAPAVAPAAQLELLRLAIRNACVIGTVADRAAQAVQDPTARQVMDQWMADARLALQEPDPEKWPDPLSLETLRLAVVVAGQQGKIAEANELSSQAAVLLGRLASDPWWQRLETVEMEVYLDQAWFGWLADPRTAREHLEALQGHLLELVRGAANSFSEKMAAEFAALLWLSLDRQQDAARLYYISNPGGSWAEFLRTFGLGYARLLAFAGGRVPAEQADMWAARGKKALGEDLWQRVSAAAAAQKDTPWWFGVLSGG